MTLCLRTVGSVILEITPVVTEEWLLLNKLLSLCILVPDASLTLLMQVDSSRARGFGATSPLPLPYGIIVHIERHTSATRNGQSSHQLY